MPTAPALVSVVVIEPPAAMLKLLLPAPPVFTLIVMGPDAEIAFEIVMPVEDCSNKFPLVRLAAVANVPPLLSRVKAPVPVLIAVPGKVRTPEEMTVSGTFATLSVGAAKVKLPVLDTKAPLALAVRVRVPVVTVAIGTALEPMLPGVKGAVELLPM